MSSASYKMGASNSEYRPIIRASLVMALFQRNRKIFEHPNLPSCHIPAKDQLKCYKIVYFSLALEELEAEAYLFTILHC
jgi:hypothetical protein